MDVEVAEGVGVIVGVDVAISVAVDVAGDEEMGAPEQTRGKVKNNVA